MLESKGCRDLILFLKNYLFIALVAFAGFVFAYG